MLPTWLAASKRLIEKREMLRKLALNWLDLAPGEIPFLAIPRLIQPLNHFLDELELPDAPLPTRFTQLAGSRTSELVEVARLQSEIGEQLPNLRKEAKVAAQRLVTLLLPPNIPASMGPRDLLAVAERLSNGPAISALSGATLTPLVTKLREAKTIVTSAKIDMESWTAEHAQTMAQAFRDAIDEPNSARRLGLLSALPFDEVEPLAVLMNAATELLSNLDERRRQTIAGRGPSNVPNSLTKARETIDTVQQTVKEIKALLP
jgi:hypothetical protein